MKTTKPTAKKAPAKKTVPARIPNQELQAMVAESQVVTELPPGAQVMGQHAKPKEQPGLTMEDMGMFKSIIEVASSRGAFRPEEMARVGELYTKLTQFLDQAQQNG